MTLSCQRAPHPDAGHWPVAMSSACNGPVAPVRRRWNSIPREPAISATAEYAMAVIAACEAQCPLWPTTGLPLRGSAKIQRTAWADQGARRRPQLWISRRAEFALDNTHHATALGRLANGSLRAHLRPAREPYVLPPLLRLIA